MSNNRNPYNNFNDPDEYLYRWFSPEIEFDYEGNLSAAALSEVFKPPRDISCNRSAFCNNSTDVLYNIKELPHRHDHGVIETLVRGVHNFVFTYDYSQKKGETMKQIIVFQVVHSPEECMYPHSEIIVYRDGERIKDVKQSGLKTLIRRELSKKFKVCHKPNPTFILE